MTNPKRMEIEIGEDFSTAVLGGISVKVTPNSNVIVYGTGVDVEKVAGTPESATTAVTDPSSVTLYQARIVLGPEGNLTVHTPGKVRLEARAPQTAIDAARDTLAFGERDQHGWISMGVLSATTGQPLYWEPRYADKMPHNNARYYARELGKQRKFKGARLPSPQELLQIHGALGKNFRNAIAHDIHAEGDQHWSSQYRRGEYPAYVDFADGKKGTRHWGTRLSVRCVR